MEKQHRELIRKNYRQLSQQFSTAMDDVCDFLYQTRIFSEHMRQDILAERTPIERGYRLLDVITKRGPKAFESLYQASLDATLYYACDILKPENAPHEPKEEISSSSDFELEDDSAKVEPEIIPQSKWPSEEYIRAIESFDLCCLNVDNPKGDYEKYMQNGVIYEMKRKPRGYPLVVEWKKQALNPLDRIALQLLFNGLGFSNLRVVKITNAEDVDGLVENELAFTKDCDCFVLFIVAPREDCFLNGDGRNLLIKKAKENIMLSKKPKLIFDLSLQTNESNSQDTAPAQGNTTNPVAAVESRGLRVDPDPIKETPMYSQRNESIGAISMKRQPSLEHQLYDIDLRLRDSHDGPTEGEETPEDSDFCFIKANEHGCEYLEIKTGSKMSRFIHLVVDIFSKNANKLDLVGLLSKAKMIDQVVQLNLPMSSLDCLSKGVESMFHDSQIAKPLQCARSKGAAIAEEMSAFMHIICLFFSANHKLQYLLN